MNTQTDFYAFLIIAVCAVCTMLTRAVPFMIFGGKRKVPKTVEYLGKVLPPTIIATLVIYCIRNVDFIKSSTHGLAEIIGILTAGVLHAVKGNALLSIGVSTVLYMVLLRNTEGILTFFTGLF